MGLGSTGIQEANSEGCERSQRQKWDGETAGRSELTNDDGAIANKQTNGLFYYSTIVELEEMFE